jgi:hypothetical protein
MDDMRPTLVPLDCGPALHVRANRLVVTLDRFRIVASLELGFGPCRDLGDGGQVLQWLIKYLTGRSADCLSRYPPGRFE